MHKSLGTRLGDNRIRLESDTWAQVGFVSQQKRVNMLTGCTPAHGYIKEPLGAMFQWLDLSRSRDVICWKKLNSLKLAAMENPMG